MQAPGRKLIWNANSHITEYNVVGKNLSGFGIAKLLITLAMQAFDMSLSNQSFTYCASPLMVAG